MASSSTLVHLFARRVEQEAGQAPLWVKRDARYVSLTWEELRRDVLRAAAALRNAGVQRHDRVALVSENRYEWIVADLAIQLAGGIHVPVHATLTGSQISWQVQHSGSKVLLVSTREQLGKLNAHAAELAVEHFVSFERDSLSLGDHDVRPWEIFLQAAAGEDLERLWAEALDQVQPDHLATILYTSGTTGEPKGVMLSQSNLVANCLGTLEAFGEGPPELRLNFLPLSHVFARTCDLYCWLARPSAQLALAESRDTILADCAQVHPTWLNGVPYFYEKLYRYLQQQGRAEEPGALAQLLGGRIRRCCSGGAALPVHLYDFFFRQEVPLLEGYGLSETSPVITASTPSAHRRGCAGRPIPGVEVRIAEDGEVLTRGPHVMQGYWRDEPATQNVIQGGWLHTGDLGQLDEQGYLSITGRKKELIVLASGKKVAPAYLESLLTQDPFILQAVVVGDGYKCLAALIVPDPDALRSEILRRQIPVRSREEALQHPEVLQLYRDHIQQRMAEVAPHEQIRKFRLLGRGFTIESGELTPKLSLRRDQIARHFAQEIEELFAE